MNMGLNYQGGDNGGDDDNDEEGDRPSHLSYVIVTAFFEDINASDYTPMNEKDCVLNGRSEERRVAHSSSVC